MEEGSDIATIDKLVERVAAPLEATQVDTDVIKTEFGAYAVQYIARSSLDYHSVWCRVFHIPNSAEWDNVLVLAELLFSLPASNRKLERVFSILGTIKVDK